jgi:subtilisin family serine protease
VISAPPPPVAAAPVPAPVPAAAAAAGPLAGTTSVARAGVAPGGRVSVTEVTLITGDRVRVISGPGARESAEIDRRYARHGIGYVERSVPGPGRQPDLVVIPTDAARLIGSGVLDENLFDVSELARDRYGDPARSTLPLIVTYRGGAASSGGMAAARALTAGGDAVVAAALPSIGGAAIAESKRGAAGFWSALARAPQVARVLLDGPVRPASGPSGPSATVATATRAGSAPSTAPGAGVLVADLDTGYDAGHPDLAGVVVAAMDFTGSKHGIQDEVGHGTWTASIIAGSGAASQGKYQGVAPGARLLVGKVLGDDGTGTESQVIAGMQWAVAQHARIVNMSLGSSAPWICPAGVDPVSQALDSLSASSRTLFVAAAGNSGPGFLDAPGVARRALTVGAVDSSGMLAFFSGTGPACGDFAVKPDVTAPGVGIVGALAAGTSLCPFDGIPGDGPVNAFYTRCSGTSAATPYVSGAAAILAQEHPRWSGAQLKSALTSSADPAVGASAYAQGDGQADIARATAQNAYASPASLAYLSPWPHLAGATKTVTYHNTGTTPLSLNLATAVSGPDGKPAPAGMVTASPSQITVPPGAETSVQVNEDPALGVTGIYNGWLTAMSPDGTTVLHTAIGAANQPQLETVTVKTIDRNGRPQADVSLAEPSAGLINLATGNLTLAVVNKAGKVTAAVPPGRYDLTDVVDTTANGKQPESLTLIDDPAMTVNRDMTVTADARRGHPLLPVLDSRVGNIWGIAQLAQTVAGTTYYSFALTLPGGPLLYAAPTGAVTGRPYEFFGDLWCDNSPFTHDHLAIVTYSLQSPSAQRIPELPYRLHDSALAVYRPELRQQGKPMTRIDQINLILGPLETAISAASGFSGSEFFIPPAGTITEFMTPGTWETTQLDLYGPLTTLTPNIAWFEAGPPHVLRAGHAYHEVWGSAALSTASITTRSGDVITPDIQPDSESAPEHIGNLTNGLIDGLSGTLTLRRGTTVIGTGPIASQPTFKVPAAAARYTLSAIAKLNVPWSTLGTSARATWTFRSGHVGATSTATLPLWDVRVSGAFNSLDQVPAGQPFRLVIAPDLAAGSPTAKITAITVRASFDDGKTWHRLVLRPIGPGAPGTWTTTITPPKEAAFVSLSDNLTDAAGDTAQQTVIRAYQVRPQP